MKLCPKCEANVEGLIHHCDCCGALLNPEKHFFGHFCGEVSPDFGWYVQQIMTELNTVDTSKYEDFLEHVGFTCYCYTQWMLDTYNMKSGLRYYENKKYASVTLTIDFNRFAYVNEEKTEYTDKKHRIRMIAEAIKDLIHLLQKRLDKYHHDITGLVVEADLILEKYLK